MSTIIYIYLNQSAAVTVNGIIILDRKSSPFPMPISFISGRVIFPFFNLFLPRIFFFFFHFSEFLYSLILRIAFAFVCCGRHYVCVYELWEKEREREREEDRSILVHPGKSIRRFSHGVNACRHFNIVPQRGRHWHKTKIYILVPRYIDIDGILNTFSSYFPSMCIYMFRTKTIYVSFRKLFVHKVAKDGTRKSNLAWKSAIYFIHVCFEINVKM